MQRRRVDEATFSKASVVTIPSLDGYLKPVTVYGKSTQASTPTPAAPVPIVSTTGNVTVQSDTKNLIQVTATTTTKDGLTFTVNADKSLTVTGTSTGASTANLALTSTLALPANTTFTLSGITNGSAPTYYLEVAVKMNGVQTYQQSFTTPKTFTTVEATTSNQMRFTYRAGAVINVTVYPQLEVGAVATAFEKNTQSTQTLPLGTTQLRSLPNGVSDRIYKDGSTWKLEQNVGSNTITGGSALPITLTNGTQFVVYVTPEAKGGTDTIVEASSNRFNGINRADREAIPNSIYSFPGQGSLRINTTVAADTTAFNTWLATNQPVVQYNLATPITTTITDPTLITALENIRTYQGVTNITAGTPVSGVYLPNSLRTAATNRTTVQDMKCSLSLNGSSSYVSLAQTSGLPLYNTTSYSIAVWFKVGGSSALDQRLYAEGFTGDAGPTFAISIAPNTNNKIRVYLRNTTSTILINNSIADISLKTTGWNHIVWADKGGVCAMYINGVKSGTNFNYTPAGSYGFNTTVFGAQTRTSTANFLNGNMCNGQLFNYSLSQSQVLAVMNDTLDGNVGSYALQEGAGTIAYDTSGNGNHGTITAGTWSSDVPSKKRDIVGGNMVYNGDFSFVPPTNVAQTVNGFIDGTSGGSVTNKLFGLLNNIVAGSTQTIIEGREIRISSMTLGSSAYVIFYADSVSSKVRVAPSTSYTVTFTLRTTLNSGGGAGGAYVAADSFRGDNTYISTNSSSTIGSTTTSLKYSFTFTTAANASYINLYAYVNGATRVMDAWFSNIDLRPTTLVPRGIA